MTARPSAPLLKLLRELAQKKGLNTARLARSAGIDRARLKHVLAGSEPLTVDELMQLSQALGIDASDLAAMPDPPAGSADEAPAFGAGNAALKQVEHYVPDDILSLDPYGNHAEQALRLVFGLGCNAFLVLDSAHLEGTGVPPQVLKRFPTHLAVQLDAAFMEHYKAAFLKDHLQIVLSFDALYTCHLPWRAFHEIRFQPLPPSEPDVDHEPPPTPGSRGHLRLVE